MADTNEETSTGDPSSGGRHAKATRDVGWYALGENPNEQSYWDGTQWIGIRHWVAGRGWIESSNVPEAVDTEAPPSKGRHSANPYAQAPWPHTVTVSSVPATLSVGVLLIMVAGVALMVGSVYTWIHVSGTLGIVNFHASVNGIDQSVTNLIGVNGWVTFIGGVSTDHSGFGVGRILDVEVIATRILALHEGRELPLIPGYDEFAYQLQEHQA